MIPSTSSHLIKSEESQTFSWVFFLAYLPHTIIPQVPGKKLTISHIQKTNLLGKQGNKNQHPECKKSYVYGFILSPANIVSATYISHKTERCALGPTLVTKLLKISQFNTKLHNG